MTAEERWKAILEFLAETGSASCYALAGRFGVSDETIRRDLIALEADHKLRRIRGGAQSLAEFGTGPDPLVIPTLAARIGENPDKKRAAAEAALSLINDGDSIALDSGSTINILAELIAERLSDLSVVTYSLDAVLALSRNKGIRIIVPGGSFEREERVFEGFLTEEALSRLHVSKAFISPLGISESFGVSINQSQFYPLEMALMQIADKKIVVADSTKFGVTTPIKICGLREIDAYATDASLPASMAEHLKSLGAAVVFNPQNPRM